LIGRTNAKSENVTQEAAGTTLQALAAETLELQQELQRLLDTYPEEHLADGELRILNCILSPRWRHLSDVNKSIDQRYQECGAWALHALDYIKRLQRHFQLADESNERIERLPLREVVKAVVDLPATELVDRLGLQWAMLQKWSQKAEERDAERSAAERQPRAVNKARQVIVREVLKFKGLNVSHLEICKSLDAKKIPTPRRTEWSNLGWVAAYMSDECKPSVQRWLSGILTD
jgi:hypothetical protein